MYTIQPFSGPLPLQFGMTPDEISVLAKPPYLVYTGPFGNRIESREGIVLAYDLHTVKLNEAVVSAGPLMFHGIDIFTLDDAISYFCNYDSRPLKGVGMIFFVKIGVRLSGFLGDETEEKSVGLTKEGHWDEYLLEFVDYIHGNSI